MIVYKAENTITGKCYVGITTQAFSKRISEHHGRSDKGVRQHKFYLSLRKHGKLAFQWSVLDTADNIQTLTAKEQYYIAVYGSYHKGYNCTPGGDVVSPETKLLISKALKGRDVTWGYKTKATRIARGNYGTTKVSGADHWKAGSFLITSPEGHVENVNGLRAFCRDHNLTPQLMLAVAKGVQSHHKGFTCQYLVEPSTTIPQGSTSQTIGDGNGEHPQG